MSKTFCNTPLTTPGWYRVKTEKGHYVMSPYWIDTTSPTDMMEYDFTASPAELYKQCRERHSIWNSHQARLE
jgi:hypothetical protein